MLKEMLRSRKEVKEAKKAAFKAFEDEFIADLTKDMKEEERTMFNEQYALESKMAEIKHYGKYVLGAAVIGGLGYLAVQALKDEDIESDDIIEGVFEEIGD